jgi:hypothetical protein
MLELVEIGSSFDCIPNAFISKELVMNLFSGIKNNYTTIDDKNGVSFPIFSAILFVIVLTVY